MKLLHLSSLISAFIQSVLTNDSESNAWSTNIEVDLPRLSVSRDFQCFNLKAFFMNEALHNISFTPEATLLSQNSFMLLNSTRVKRQLKQHSTSAAV